MNFDAISPMLLSAGVPREHLAMVLVTAEPVPADGGYVLLFAWLFGLLLLER